MPNGSGTSPTEKSGENARSAGTNNYYNKPERPRNNIGGLEELTLIKRSRTPALDLKKAREALQSKIQREEKDGYVAATLLNEAESQTASTVGRSQQIGGSTHPTPPTMPDRTSDNFIFNRTFNLLLYEAAVAEYKQLVLDYWVDMKIWEANKANASGISKHTKNNAHKMAATLMVLLSDDLKVKVQSDGRFPRLKAEGDIKGLFDLVEEKVCGLGDGEPKVLSWIKHLKVLLNSWQASDQLLGSYRESKDAQRAFVSKLNEGGVTLAPDFLVRQILRQEGMNDKEIENLKYGSKKLKKAKEKAEEIVLAFVYLYGANRTRFGSAITHLENNYVCAPNDQKDAAFKSTPQEALKFLSNWRTPYAWRGPRDTAVQYYSRVEVLKDAQGKVNEEAKTGCAHCGNPDGDSHYMRDCELLSEDDKRELDATAELAAKRLEVGRKRETESSRLPSAPAEVVAAANPEPRATHVQTLRQTIDESGLTKRQVANAERAYKYAERTGHRSQREAEYLVVSDPAFQKAGISLEDMKNAHALFGPQSVSSIKGKTTRRAPDHVRTDYVAVPRDFLKLQKNVTLVVDVVSDYHVTEHQIRHG